MDPWRTAIVEAKDGEIRVRGYDITALMSAASFTDTVFLLHRGRMPTPEERRMLDALLVAVADHGSGAPSCAAARLALSGNRQSLSSAIAAGVLAIGDEHGGAGSGAIELIATGVERAKERGSSLEESAMQLVAELRRDGRRVPGLGHRLHSTDPRTALLFEMARTVGLAGDGIAFMTALESAVAATIKRLPLNIDGALAAVLYDMGFDAPFGRLMFIIGRVAGLSAEVSEELAREKAMRIHIPVRYDGPPPRPLA